MGSTSLHQNYSARVYSRVTNRNSAEVESYSLFARGYGRILSETVTGSITAMKPQGWKGDLGCFLVFTSQRLLVSFKSVWGSLASSGGFGIAGAAVASHGDANKRSQMQGMSPDQILQGNKKNFDVPYSRITKLELGKARGGSMLHIFTQDQAYEFRLTGVKAEQAEGWLRNTIPTSIPVQTIN